QTRPNNRPRNGGRRDKRVIALSGEVEQHLAAPRDAQELGAVGVPQRTAEQAPYNGVALVRPPKLDLPASLDPLGYDGQVQIVSHRNDAAGDGAVIDVSRHAVHERTVDLENIDGEALQIAQ